MEERFAPSGRPALARKARFFIWGFAAFCAILVLLAWFLRPNPSAVLWRAQEERFAVQRAYDSRTFVDACNASLQPYGIEILWADAQWKLVPSAYDLYRRDMTVYTPDDTFLLCSLVALSKEQPNADTSLPLHKVMLSYILLPNTAPAETPSSFYALFQSACDFYEPGLAETDPDYATSLQSAFESCLCLHDFEEYLPRYSGSSPDCPTAFYFVSESFGSEAFLGKLVAIHTCPESCPE